MSSQNGLNYYPSAGDSITFYVRFSNNDERGGMFIGVPSNGNGYKIHVSANDNQFSLQIDGQNSIASDSASIGTSNWYRVEVDWYENGDFDGRLYDDGSGQIASWSTNDTTYSSGGVGWQCQRAGSATSRMRFDEATAQLPYDPPQNLTATENDADVAYVDLSWTFSDSGHDGFRVYRATSSGTTTDDYTVAGTTSAGQTEFTDTNTAEDETYYYRVVAYNDTGTESEPSNEANHTTSLYAPGVSASVQANGQIDLDITDNSSAEIGYEVEMERDGSGWSAPAGGPSTPGTGSGTHSYNPSSDSSYEKQVGIDSSFRFRARATGNNANSIWTTSGTVYTDPIPPHDPSVSRPDGTTIELTHTIQSDIADRTVVMYREDTGSGYGSWSWFDTIHGGESHVTGTYVTGNTLTATYQTGTTYDGGVALQTDARYQFRLSHLQPGKVSESGKVRADYGNYGGVAFTDGFESADLSAWDSTSLADTNSGVVNNTATPDTGISGSAEGSHHLRLDAGDSVTKQLGDLSGLSGVHVRAKVSVGSMDGTTELASIKWFNGSWWQVLTKLPWEYNKQGWVEVHTVVPDADLSTDNRLKLVGGGTGGGDLTVFDDIVVADTLNEYATPAAPSALSLDASTEDQIAASWTDNATFEDAHKARIKPTGGSVIETKNFAGTGCTFSGLDDGEDYTVEAWSLINQHRRGNHDQFFTDFASSASATTVLPAPTLDNITVNGDQFDVAFTPTDDHPNPTYRVQVAHDGSSWSDAGSGASSPITTTSLLDGEQYDVRVAVETEHTISHSSTATATTVLPDAKPPSLDNGSEDEIGVSWPDVTDNGDYRVEYKETSASAWMAATVVGHDTLQTTISSLEDGEAYDVRVRTETEHRTGNWASNQITTAFPKPSNVSAVLSSSNPKTEIELSWDDQSDNEDNLQVYEAKQFDTGWSSFRKVADLAPNTTSYTAQVSPGNTYKFKIEAYTEDSTSTSDETIAVTTNSSGEPRERTGADGWEVKIEHPSGQVLRPQLLDDPTFTPKVNDLPQVEFAVPHDERWMTEAFEEAPLSVWRDGRKLPIDELVDVRMESGQTVLVGRGGVDLLERVQTEYDFKKVHTAAQELVQQNTDYTANVDPPETVVESDVLVQSADSKTDFENRYQNNDAATNPIITVSGDSYGDGDVLQCAQTAFVDEAEAVLALGGTVSDAAASAGNTEGHTYASDSYSVSLDYAIPGDHVGVAVRYASTGDPDRDDRYETNGFDVLVDGETILTEWDGTSWSDSSYRWVSSTGRSASIGSGSVTVKFDGSRSTGSSMTWIDLIVLFDARYHDPSGFDNSIDSNGYLSSPTEYPIGATKDAAPERVFGDAEVVESVTGGRVENLGANDQSGLFRVGLSNDGGDTWNTSSSVPYEVDWQDLTPTLRWKIRLGGTEATRTTATPTQGYESQKIEQFDLRADTEDMPIVMNQSFDGQLLSVLQDLADNGNYVFELRRGDDGASIEWCQPGQRSSPNSPSVASYSVQKSSDLIDKAVVYGRSQPQTGEKFIANHGTAVSLTEQHLVESQETVRDPNTGTIYARGKDYEMEYSSGTITTLTDGDMTDGTTYEIDYHRKTDGTYTADGVTDPRTIVRNIPALTTDRACGLAARQIVEEGKKPEFTATVTIPTAEERWSVVDELPLPEVPTGQKALQVRRVQNAPDRTVLTLGSRRSVENVIENISDRIQALSKRV